MLCLTGSDVIVEMIGLDPKASDIVYTHMEAITAITNANNNKVNRVGSTSVSKYIQQRT
jgi:hypothetical protein